MSHTLMDRVAEAERRDPGRIRPVLQVLVGDKPDVVTSLRPVASPLNAARRAAAIKEFIAGSLSTEEVMARLGVATRQAVHRLRDRGRLWGRTIGNATWYPAWQFGETGLLPDLPRLLVYLARYSTDAVSADRVMRLSRPELDGRSLAEALEDHSSSLIAWRLLGALGSGG